MLKRRRVAINLKRIKSLKEKLKQLLKLRVVLKIKSKRSQPK
jgi:hypothetical protein